MFFSVDFDFSIAEGAQVHIALLSPSDGRLDLVQTASDYCHAVSNRMLKPTDISTDLVNSMLQGKVLES